jgi:hypothetical protein
MSVCVCGACKRSFSGLGSFDRHQDVDYSRRPAVRCLDPASVGLVRQDQGRWGVVLDEQGRERLRKLRAAR